MPPTTASDAIRPQRGIVGCSFHTSARAIATSIGPTSHPAGRPAIWAMSPANKEPTPRAIHPTAVRIALDPLLVTLLLRLPVGSSVRTWRGWRPGRSSTLFHCRTLGYYQAPMKSGAIFLTGPIRNFFDASHGCAVATDEEPPIRMLKLPRVVCLLYTFV